MRNIYDTLVGLAYGDSFGMPVELWPRLKAKAIVGKVDRLLPGQCGNFVTSNLQRGEVTDDTIISLILCRQLVEEGDIDPEHFINRLMTWVEKNEKRANLIGPSTRKVIELHRTGELSRQTGLFGETNGGAMRIAPVGIFFDVREFDIFISKVHLACIATHNTAIAISAAAAVSAAISYGVHIGNDIDEMLVWVKKAAVAGRNFGRDLGYPYIEKRLELILSLFDRYEDRETRMEILHTSLGTTVQAIESIPASLAAVIISNGKIREALDFTANLGGDTDTMSAITGAICGALNGCGQILDEDIKLIEQVNDIDFRTLTHQITEILTNQS